MGTLGNQPRRSDFVVSNEYLDAWLSDVVLLAKKHSINVDSVIAEKRVLEMSRRNSMDSLAGDYHDEHMGGLGEILSRIAEALESLKQS